MPTAGTTPQAFNLEVYPSSLVYPAYNRADAVKKLISGMQYENDN